MLNRKRVKHILRAINLRVQAWVIMQIMDLSAYFRLHGMHKRLMLSLLAVQSKSKALMREMEREL